MLLDIEEEPSIRALAVAIKEEWKGGEIVPEMPPKGSSQSNGEVENGVKMAHGLARTLKESLEQ
eukprot:1352888-Lingulodinium_polyedra.AAC.1